MNLENQQSQTKQVQNLLITDKEETLFESLPLQNHFNVTSVNKPNKTLQVVSKTFCMESEEQDIKEQGQPWGVGARPKNTNVLDWLQIDKEQNLTPRSTTVDQERIVDNPGAQPLMLFKNDDENIFKVPAEIKQASNSDKLGNDEEVNDVQNSAHASQSPVAGKRVDTHEILSQNNSQSAVTELMKPQVS